MRQARLHGLVAELIENSFDGGDRDVADVLLADRDDDHGTFAALCRRLAMAGEDTEDGIRTAWSFLMQHVDDRLKDRLAGGEIQQPAIYLGALL